MGVLVGAACSLPVHSCLLGWLKPELVVTLCASQAEGRAHRLGQEETVLVYQVGLWDGRGQGKGRREDKGGGWGEGRGEQGRGQVSWWRVKGRRRWSYGRWGVGFELRVVHEVRCCVTEA